MLKTEARTKIIATIGPATSSIETIAKLIEKGVDVARLNFSHNTLEEHSNLIQNIRRASQKTGKEIAILQDLQGPKIRIKNFKNGFVTLHDNSEFIITTNDIPYGNENIVATNHMTLAEEVKIGSTILLDDGYIILKVTKVENGNIYTKVIKGGKLSDNKGIVVPGAKSSAPSVSEKDLADLKFGLEHGVDLVALSFVRSERDIIEVRTAMKLYSRIVPIIAKIERLEAVERINEIIAEADGIMVARGDLGLEAEPERVPLIQKNIVQKCRYFGKPTIIATQMLESMVSNPRPTRAEASDVANAVLDGADCLMLSAETSIGKYPIESVDYMNKIIKEVEKDFHLRASSKMDRIFTPNETWDAIARASCVLAEQIKAKGIVALTKRGFTALNIAKYRPSVPIIALTESNDVVRWLAFVWGVEAFVFPEFTNINSNEQITNFLKNKINAKPNENYVVASCGKPDELKSENIIKIVQI